MNSYPIYINTPYNNAFKKEFLRPGRTKIFEAALYQPVPAASLPVGTVFAETHPITVHGFLVMNI